MDTTNSSSSSSSRAEAERWLEIAGRLLQARDLVGSKRFAERAMEVDPLLEGVDEVLAVADVLLASQKHRPSPHPDYYSILQLPPLSPPSSLKPSYRRLALLLSPHRNSLPGSDLALKLVSDAWSFLSDPSNKRLYDQHVQSNNGTPDPDPDPDPDVDQTNPSSPPSPPRTFWTICPTCFRAHEYDSPHRGRTLLCHGCRKPFLASELPSPPPAVPGTDMYYCSWGLFPLGFPGCPPFSGAPLPAGFPRGHDGSDGGGIAPDHNPTPPPPATREKPVAQRGKKPTGRPRGRPRKDRTAEAPPPPSDDDVVGDLAAGIDMNSFSIDLDATAEALGNFANIPFVVRDDEVVMMQ